MRRVTGFATFFLLGAALLAVSDWIAVWRQDSARRSTTKPATLVALIGVAATIDVTSQVARAWFVAALAFSLLGDWLLLDHRRFRTGLGAFLLAHIAYILGMQRLQESNTALGLGLMIAVIIVAALGRGIARGAWLRAGMAEAASVVVYMLVLGAMLAWAFGTARPMAAAGAALFLISDLFLAWGRYLRPHPAGPLAVAVTYHAAQALLVVSLTRGAWVLA